MAQLVLFSTAWRRLTHLEEVDDEREDVAHEEDEDDDHEHGGHADLALLHAGQLRPLRVGPPDLQVDAQVEGGEAGEGRDVHDHQVHPRDVYTVRREGQRGRAYLKLRGRAKRTFCISFIGKLLSEKCCSQTKTPPLCHGWNFFKTTFRIRDHRRHFSHRSVIMAK